MLEAGRWFMLTDSIFKLTLKSESLTKKPTDRPCVDKREI